MPTPTDATARALAAIALVVRRKRELDAVSDERPNEGTTATLDLMEAVDELVATHTALPSAERLEGMEALAGVDPCEGHGDYCYFCAQAVECGDPHKPHCPWFRAQEKRDADGETG
jgi:hypothetical protein